jgi:ribosomal protein S18 acetylase RimI-like enzyme
MVEVSADVVADSLVEAMDTWLSASPSSSGSSNGVVWLKSAIPAFAFFNIVFARGADVTPSDLDVAASAFDDPEWRFRVEARPEAVDIVSGWARANGREQQPEELSWQLTDPGALDTCRDLARGESTRRLGPADMFKHRAVLESTFGMDSERSERIFTDALASVPGVSIRLAEVDGEPAGTAMSILTSTGGVGVFSVAVRDQFRRRGVGREVTAAVIGDALESGGEWAFLEASDGARAIYQRMGFQPISGWHSFQRPAASD